MKKIIKDLIVESIFTKEKTIDLISNIEEVFEILLNTYLNGNKILIAGNGGSAADAQHFAAELVGRFKLDRSPLPCIALTTDTSIITAWANDASFEDIFSRQIEALGKKGDTFIGISTSGNSKNVINAVQTSSSLGLSTIALLGNNGGEIMNLVDSGIIVPSNNTPRIQEVHIMIIHILCELLELKLFSKN